MKMLKAVFMLADRKALNELMYEVVPGRGLPAKFFEGISARSIGYLNEIEVQVSENIADTWLELAELAGAVPLNTEWVGNWDKYGEMT